jgi:ribosomal protein L37AE/L43A
MTERVISIGKRWPNSRVPWNKRGSRGGKPKLTAYCFDDKTGRFFTKSIDKLTALVKKFQILPRKKVMCLLCGARFRWFVKNGKADLDYCPSCGEYFGNYTVVKTKCPECGHKCVACEGVDSQCPRCGEMFCP